MISRHNLSGDALPQMEFGMMDLSIAPTIGHLPLFNQHLQQTNRTVEWVYDDLADTEKGDQPQNAYRDMGLSPDITIKGTKETPLWYVKVLVDGEFYGRGRGNTKKAARDEAAKEGLKKMGIKF
jgi:ribonuclease-3